MELQPLLRDKDLEKLIGVDVKSLERWRREATGPAYIRAGRQVRYQPQDVQAWLEERKTTPAA